ncbi:MAG: FMN-binding protein [Anaerohalosphaeraceae bacterium]|nr:FMN-binding protein [Anaerohalosphaeraceae bacterium]
MFRLVRYYIKQSWLLVVSAFVFGLLLAVTNSIWSGRIEQNKNDKLDNLMSGLIADAEFAPAISDIQIDCAKGKFVKVNVYKAADKSGRSKGFCFNASGAGFADKIELVIAVDAKFEKVLGYNVLSSNETPGFGDQIDDYYFCSQFSGAPVGQLVLNKSGDSKIINSEIIAISGATVSSDAVVSIFNSFVEQVKAKTQEEGLLSDGK